MSDPLLQVSDLRTQFSTAEGTIRAVDGVNFDLKAGETMGLVGESGSGKTVCALSLMRLIADPPGRIVSGSVRLAGEDLLKVDEARMRQVRGNTMAMIFQEPMTSLNPVLTIGRQVTEALELHKGLGRAEALERGVELLTLVGVPAAADRLRDYPHQFSGGMRQRVMIAMALSCEPRVLIADEPTTALDVTIQAQVLEVIARLSKNLGTAMILITHNLGVIARYAEYVRVMYAGRIVEAGPAREIFRRPRHAYTLGLLESVPRVDARRGQLVPIPGTPPNPAALPEGCAFASRCRFTTTICRQERPVLDPCGPGRHVACWHADAVLAAAEELSGLVAYESNGV